MSGASKISQMRPSKYGMNTAASNCKALLLPQISHALYFDLGKEQRVRNGGAKGGEQAGVENGVGYDQMA